MNKKLLFVMLLAAVTMLSVTAQPPRPPRPGGGRAAPTAASFKLSGDLTPLKGQSEVNVVIDFSGTLVNGKAESAFIEAETKGKSAEEKEQWLKEWNEDLRSQANSLLIAEINNNLGGQFTVGNNSGANCTITIKVVDITSGSFSGPFSKSSAIKAGITFSKKGEASPFASVASANVSNGASSVIPVLATRISMSFGTLGVQIASTINKNLK
jgi:hypothetical protein